MYKQLVCISAYDYTSARAVRSAGCIDILFVLAEEVAQCAYGLESAAALSLEVCATELPRGASFKLSGGVRRGEQDMVKHTQAVTRGVAGGPGPDPLVIAELPPCSFEPNCEQGMAAIAVDIAAAREVLTAELLPAASMLVAADPPAASGVLLHGGCGGGVEQLQMLRRAGIPAMVRLGGLSHARQGGGPPAAETSPGFVATDYRDAVALLKLAQRLNDAGAVAMVLDNVASEAALGICDTLSAPVIGMGCGPAESVQGQLVMLSELLGLDAGGRQRLALHEPYGLLGDIAARAISNYADDTTHGVFPPKELVSVFFSFLRRTRSRRRAWAVLLTLTQKIVARNE